MLSGPILQAPSAANTSGGKYSLKWNHIYTDNIDFQQLPEFIETIIDKYVKF
jgi:hypothetical protein